MRLIIQHSNTREAGWYTIFFTVFVLPLLFILGTLSLDLSEYFMARQRLQQLTDTATVQASRYLPNQEQAREFAENYIKEFSTAVVDTNINVSNDLLSIQAEYGFRFTLSNLAGVKSMDLPVRAFSMATFAPRDLLLFIDVGSNLAPIDNNLWGDLPVSNFYQNLYPVIGMDGSVVDPKWLTQKCQNPILTEIKKASINFYSFFSNFESIQLGFGIFPGSFSNLSMSRPALLSAEKLDGEDIYLRREERGFLGWSDTLCAALAEEEQDSSFYQFPVRSSDQNRPLRISIPASWNFNSDYESFLTVQEYIWMLVAEEQKQADFSEVLTEARPHISGSRFLANRGNLATRVRRSAVFISPSLPQVAGQKFPDIAAQNALVAALGNYRQDVMRYGLDLSLYFVLYNPSNSPVINSAASINDYRNFLNQQEQENGQKLNGFKLRLLEIINTEDLNQGLQNLIAMEEDRALLRR
jgi:hypothetical protein